MSARRKGRKRGGPRSNSNKRNRSEFEYDDHQQILRQMGFNQQQIDVIWPQVDPHDAVNSALSLLQAQSDQIPHQSPQSVSPKGPKAKRRKIRDMGHSDREILNLTSEDEKKSQNGDQSNSNINVEPSEPPKKRTHAERLEQEFQQRQQKMEQKEKDYKEWLRIQLKTENAITEIRDHIQMVYQQCPPIGNNKNNGDDGDDQNEQIISTSSKDNVIDLTHTDSKRNSKDGKDSKDSKDDDDDDDDPQIPSSHCNDSNSNNNGDINMETNSKTSHLMDSKPNNSNVSQSDTAEINRLRELLQNANDALQNHLKFANRKVDEAVMQRETVTSRMERARHEFEQYRNEFMSQKMALELMEEDAKSGRVVMTLEEYNRFVVANVMNKAEGHMDNEHFKKLFQNMQILENQRHSPSHSCSHSNSKQENDDDDGEGKSAEFECGICFTTFGSLSEILIFECHHFYCMDCLKGTLKVKLEERNVRNISCPFDKCEHKLTHQEIQFILTKEEFEKFDAYLLDKTLQAAKDCRFCPGVDCGAAMFGFEDSPMLTCPKCEKQFCFNCGTEEWHRGVTCEAFKRWKEENGKADAAFAEWQKKQGAKECPQCKTTIEKNGGCDHMTCKNCGFEFHWVTMEKWRGYDAVYDIPQDHPAFAQQQEQQRIRQAFRNGNWGNLAGLGLGFGNLHRHHHNAHAPVHRQRNHNAHVHAPVVWGFGGGAFQWGDPFGRPQGHAQPQRRQQVQPQRPRPVQPQAIQPVQPILPPRPVQPRPVQPRPVQPPPPMQVQQVNRGSGQRQRQRAAQQRQRAAQQRQRAQMQRQRRNQHNQHRQQRVNRNAIGLGEALDLFDMFDEDDFFDLDDVDDMDDLQLPDDLYF